MAKKLKIEKLTLRTASGNRVDLSIEEAKDLYDQLDMLFGNQIEYIPPTPVVIPWHYPPLEPYVPMWCNETPYVKWTTGVGTTMQVYGTIE